MLCSGMPASQTALLCCAASPWHNAVAFNLAAHLTELHPAPASIAELQHYKHNASGYKPSEPDTEQSQQYPPELRIFDALQYDIEGKSSFTPQGCCAMWRPLFLLLQIAPV